MVGLARYAGARAFGCGENIVTYACGDVDAFWVGEPWGSVAVQQNVGQLMMAGRDVWQFAPEKVLAARHDWVAANDDAVRRLMRAVYQA